jgi:hypothetical protein
MEARGFAVSQINAAHTRDLIYTNPGAGRALVDGDIEIARDS